MRSFEIGYMKEVVKKIVNAIDRKKEIMPLNILDMRMADRAWRKVAEKTIINCFRKADFVKEVENEIEIDEEQETSTELENEMKNEE